MVLFSTKNLGMVKAHVLKAGNDVTANDISLFCW